MYQIIEEVIPFIAQKPEDFRKNDTVKFFKTHCEIPGTYSLDVTIMEALD